ncbi:hypothetical protein GQ600_26320 [Phytophthora cactorum]|nr:hypothetical protein GQ600_26320 [Phytophthora cactorum]
MATDVETIVTHALAIVKTLVNRGNRRGEEKESRRIHNMDSPTKSRRIAPNVSALKSIMLGTARSRDRMDERERARAQKKLESLDTANALVQ